MSRTREDENVPANVRSQVLERDAGCCRVCGRYTDRPALHHVRYRSEGGLDVPANLITIGWLPGEDCHLPVVHAHKRLWQPILEVVVVTDGVNGLQLLRWARRRASSPA